MNFRKGHSIQKILKDSVKNEGLGSFKKENIFLGTIETISKFKFVVHQECNLLYHTNEGYVYYEGEKKILVKANDNCRIINLVHVEQYIPIHEIYSYTYQGQEFLITEDCVALEKYNYDYNL